MQRTLLTREELEVILTAELQQVEDCGACTITGIIPIEPDETGCNWSEDITIQRADVPVEYVYPIARRIVAEARKRYNLYEEGNA